MKRALELYSEEFKFKPLLVVVVRWLEGVRLIERYPKLYRIIHLRMMSLYGRSDSQPLAYLFIAQMLVSMFIVCCFFLFLFVVFHDPYLLFSAAVIAIFIGWLLIRECDRKIQKKKQLICLELPIVISRLLLLLQAGETVQHALTRIVNGMQKPFDHPLYRGLLQVSQRLENRVSFTHVLEEWNQDMGVQEISLFVHTILLNYRRGGSDLSRSLKALSDQLWERRKNTAKALGEEASAKLIFPMVFIFFVVMIVVAAPVLFFMK